MGTYHELICQQVLSPVSVYPKATDDDWALHHPQLPVASEDPQVAAGIRQAVDHCALQLCKTRVHSTTVHCNCTKPEHTTSRQLAMWLRRASTKGIGGELERCNSAMPRRDD